jgi:hypothetical protein
MDIEAAKNDPDIEKIVGCVPCVDGMRSGFVPYKGSSVAHCSKCDERVWLGPEQRKMHEQYGWPIICLICIYKEHGEESLEWIHPLTDKIPGE